MNWMLVLSHLYVLGFGFLFAGHTISLGQGGELNIPNVFKVFVLCILWPVLMPSLAILLLIMG